jgi:hypothetical protein
LISGPGGCQVMLFPKTNTFLGVLTGIVSSLGLQKNNAEEITKIYKPLPKILR